MSRYSKLIKNLRKNYSYTTARLQKDFGLHPQTVRGWVNNKKNPLPCIQKRPLLIFSEDLRAWLRQIAQDRKTKLEVKQCYCTACRKAKYPLEDKVYLDICKTKALMKGVCPTCGNPMNKGISIQKLELMHQYFTIITVADLHILGRATSNEKTHLGTTAKSTPSEPVNNTHLFQPISLL